MSMSGARRVTDMKQLLLATSALIVVGLIAGRAGAADRIRLTLGSFFQVMAKMNTTAGANQ